MKRLLKFGRLCFLIKNRFALFFIFSFAGRDGYSYYGNYYSYEPLCFLISRESCMNLFLPHRFPPVPLIRIYIYIYTYIYIYLSISRESCMNLFLPHRFPRSLSSEYIYKRVDYNYYVSVMR
jgi:hypothetical protein